MPIVELEKADPGPINGIFLQTAQDAMDLWAWSHELPEYTCTLVDHIDGSWSVMLESVNIAGATARAGQWLIRDGGSFLVMTDEERINLGYTVLE